MENMVIRVRGYNGDSRQHPILTVHCQGISAKKDDPFVEGPLC